MKLKILNKSSLQMIAVAAMVIDHMSFLAHGMLPYQACRFIGRITVIIMSYFVAEGYHKTRNVNNYIIRMAAFAAISQLPFYLFEYGFKLPADPGHFIAGLCFNRNVIFTLFIGLCLLTILKREKSVILKLAAFAAAWYLTRCSDWKYFGLLWILSFGMFYGDLKKQLPAVSAVIIWRFITFIMPLIASAAAYFMPPSAGLSVFLELAGRINGAAPGYGLIYSAVAQLGGFLALPLIFMYNGKRGNAPRLGFYIFYPAHLLLLFLVKLSMI